MRRSRLDDKRDRHAILQGPTVATATVRGMKMRLIRPMVAVLPILLLGAGSAQASYWKPPAKLSWYWQIQGTVNNSYGAAAYDIDGFDNTAAEVSALHALGKHVICYVDVGTSETGALTPANSRAVFSETQTARPGSSGWTSVSCRSSSRS